MTKKQTDLVLGVVLATVGIVFLTGGWNVLVFTASMIEKIGYAGKLYAIPGGLMIFIGGSSLTLLIKLIVINLTKKRPWWI